MMWKQTIAVLGALALALGLAHSASAAEFVDITYDLSDSAINAPNWDQTCTSPCISTQVFSGSMTIRYSSNSASSMPILHGPATLQSLSIQGSALAGLPLTTPLTIISQASPLNINLGSPVIGSLLSGGTLTFGSAQIQVTGGRHCLWGNYISGFCIALFGTLTSLNAAFGPYTTTQPLSFAASAGPYGGAQSTRHTVSGAFEVSAPANVYPRLTSGFFATGVDLIGREVLRQAPGHETKVTPEPGTLLLLGAGTAGLALVGRTTRRSRQS